MSQWIYFPSSFATPFSYCFGLNVTVAGAGRGAVPRSCCPKWMGQFFSESRVLTRPVLLPVLMQSSPHHHSFSVRSIRSLFSVAGHSIFGLHTCCRVSQALRPPSWTDMPLMSHGRAWIPPFWSISGHSIHSHSGFCWWKYSNNHSWYVGDKQGVLIYV